MHFTPSVRLVLSIVLTEEREAPMIMLTGHTILLATSTKLKLYSMCILPIFLYGSDCLAISKMDACKIDALDQWCLHVLLGIKWYQFVWNDDVRWLTKQPKLTAIIQSCRLTLFGHIVCMDDNADAKRILLVPFQRTGEDNQVVPASRGSAPSNRI